jgi:hypothetical protein
VIRGVAETIRSTGGADMGSCVAEDFPSTYHEPVGAPAVGEVWTYLVAARNSCGAGTYGDGEPPVGPPSLRDQNPGNCGSP